MKTIIARHLLTTFLLFLAMSVYSRSPLLDVLGPMRDEATSKESLLYKHLSHSVRKFSTTSRSRYQTLIEETKLRFTIYFMFCFANLRELITLDFLDQGQCFFWICWTTSGRLEVNDLRGEALFLKLWEICFFATPHNFANGPHFFALIQLRPTETGSKICCTHLSYTFSES